MSNKNSRKQKIKSIQKIDCERKVRNKELERLKNEAKFLEKKLYEQKKEKLKQLNIRNLKYFIQTCSFFAPFVITTTITIEVFKLFGGGFPFYSDEIIKYKQYNLDFQTNGYVTIDESYRTNRWFDESLPSSELLIYTPWKLQDDQYVRFKRKYDLSKLVTLDLYNAVLDENYEYIRENFKEYKEEKQVINKLYETEPIDYFFQAELHMLDKDDILKYNESDLKNTIITVIELIFGLGIGTIINHYRNLDYLLKLKIANNYYSYYPDLIKETKQELSKINEKTLMLSRTMDGKIL